MSSMLSHFSMVRMRHSLCIELCGGRHRCDSVSWACAGGNLVLDDRMSAGALVSFMLYQESLSSAFQVRVLCACLPAPFL